jgi:hypothetical protein
MFKKKVNVISIVIHNNNDNIITLDAQFESYSRGPLHAHLLYTLTNREQQEQQLKLRRQQPARD